jgi:hypothetical protein
MQIDPSLNLGRRQYIYHAHKERRQHTLIDFTEYENEVDRKLCVVPFDGSP